MTLFCNSSRTTWRAVRRGARRRFAPMPDCEFSASVEGVGGGGSATASQQLASRCATSSLSTTYSTGPFRASREMGRAVQDRRRASSAAAAQGAARCSRSARQSCALAAARRVLQRRLSNRLVVVQGCVQGLPPRGAVAHLGGTARVPRDVGAVSGAEVDRRPEGAAAARRKRRRRRAWPCHPTVSRDGGGGGGGGRRRRRSGQAAARRNGQRRAYRQLRERSRATAVASSVGVAGSHGAASRAGRARGAACRGEEIQARVRSRTEAALEREARGAG